MGRMLEALKSGDEAAVQQDNLLTANGVEVHEEPALEMPFIEVGGPRPAAAPRPHLENPAPRAAALAPLVPKGVALQSAQAPRSKGSRLAAELIAFHQPEHAVSQQYAALFTQLVSESSTDAATVLLLTSLAPGAGTTTVLLNLAISGCRQHQHRIVIVDTNRARPAAAQRLGLGHATGLAELLQGRTALEQAVQATVQPELYVLPAGAAEQHDQWSPEALRWVLAWLRQRFDFVLVDAPPWDAKELCSLVPVVDAVYLILDKVEAEQAQVRNVTRGIAQLGSRVGGLIVTQ